MSLDWLRARANFLTASDMHKVIGVTLAGKKRSRSTQIKAMQELWAQKQKLFDESDCVSGGIMARGHVLEPYAIEAFNAVYSYNLKHIDDQIIVGRDHPNLGWSPDAIEFEGSESLPGDVLVKDPIGITTIGEIKSYSEAQHYRVGMQLDGEERIEERWQIATAFVVCPSIEVAFLILFNPAVNEQLFAHAYVRDQLDKEIEEIEHTYKLWCEVASELQDKARTGLRCVSKTERVIYDEFEQSKSSVLNPF